MRKSLLIFSIAWLFIISPGVLAQSAPVLLFSDLVSGPRSGLGDGLGQGAIVTIWGKNLGSSQGSSKVYIKDSAGVSREAAHVYAWTNAVQQKGHPADLYTYHKMQFVQFSIPSASVEGAAKMYVNIGGVNSNELDINLSSTGTFRFVGNGCGAGQGTPANSGIGSYANPWVNPQYAVGNNPPSGMAPGDILYICDGITATNEGGSAMGVTSFIDADATYRTAILAYPGAAVAFRTTGGQGSRAFVDWRNSAVYFTISRIKLIADGSAASTGSYARIIANEITDDACGEGSSGALGSGCDDHGKVILGNYIHDFGCASTSNQQHVTYFSNRQFSGCNSVNALAHTFAWNYLNSNTARAGIHIYDEGYCGGWSGKFEIHDNVVKDQVGPALDINAGCAIGYPMNINANIYNNLFINCGLSAESQSLGPSVNLFNCYYGGNCATYNDHPGPNGTAWIYNNTIYHQVDEPAIEAVKLCPSGGASCLHWYWRNNIVASAIHSTFYETWLWTNPEGTNNNLWYYNGGTTVAPSWDTNPLTSNPLFVDPANGDFTPQPNSPACGAGDPSIGPDIGALPCETTAPGPDTTPPYRYNPSPTGTLQAGTTQVTLSLSTNEAATCRYSTTPGIPYSSMTNTFTITGGTSHSRTLTGLSNGNTYNYYVRCNDTASNYNPEDFPISFSVASPPVCGNSYCDTGETCSSCPQDCSCSSGICCSGSCTVPACSQASDCGSDPCRTYTCSSPGTCSASCSSVPKTACQSGDSCCPSGCTSQTDSDCSTIPGGLVVSYPFNEGSGTTVNDYSGNGNTGAISGAAWTTGKSGGGLSFDGVNDFVSIQKDASTYLNMQQGSISFWYKSNGCPGPSFFSFAANGDELSIGASTSRNLILYHRGDYSASGSVFTYVPEYITDRAWHHVAVTWNTNGGAETLSLTYDGVRTTDSDALVNPSSISGTSYIGSFNGVSEFFNGTIDEFRIYNRTLSSQEISDLYNQAQCIHKSDLDCSGCVSDLELFAFIDLWYKDSSNPTLKELMEAIGLWKRGGC